MLRTYNNYLVQRSWVGDYFNLCNPLVIALEGDKIGKVGFMDLARMEFRYGKLFQGKE